jgi:hypothetical protein
MNRAGAGSLERVNLAGQVLIAGRDPRIADDRHFSACISQVRYANCKALKIQRKQKIAKLRSFAKTA